MPDDSEINKCIYKQVSHRFAQKDSDFIKEIDILFNEDQKNEIENNIVILSLTDDLGQSRWKTNYINSF